MWHPIGHICAYTSLMTLSLIHFPGDEYAKAVGYGILVSTAAVEAIRWLRRKKHNKDH